MRFIAESVFSSYSFFGIAGFDVLLFLFPLPDGLVGGDSAVHCYRSEDRDAVGDLVKLGGPGYFLF